MPQGMATTRAELKAVVVVSDCQVVQTFLGAVESHGLCSRFGVAVLARGEGLAVGLCAACKCSHEALVSVHALAVGCHTLRFACSPLWLI